MAWNLLHLTKLFSFSFRCLVNEENIFSFPFIFFFSQHTIKKKYIYIRSNYIITSEYDYDWLDEVLPRMLFQEHVLLGEIMFFHPHTLPEMHIQELTPL